MSLIRPSLAQIYVREMRTHLAEGLVPVFTPDTKVVVGEIGYFNNGEFVSTGSTIQTEFGIDLDISPPESKADWQYHTDGAVNLAAGANVTVNGTELLSGKLSFTKSRAVVAVFNGVRESKMVWTQELKRRVWDVFVRELLPINHRVVWAVRSAAGGAVVVNRKKGTQLELVADPALLGGALSIGGLGAGVTFAGGSQTSFQLSGTDLTPFVRLKGLSGPWNGPVLDMTSFEEIASGDLLAELDAIEIPDVTVADVDGVDEWEESEPPESE